jgi:DNA polymerase, archaea type
MVIKSDLPLEEKNEYYQKKLPENTPSLLLSSFYIGEKKSVFLKFYNPEDSQIYFWSEYFVETHTNKHQPYCFVKELYADQVKSIVSKESHRFKLEKTKKMDDIEDREISVFKIIAPDPLSIGGTDNSFREKVTSWEADIKYHESYLFDLGLIPGAFYKRIGNSLIFHEFPIPEKVDKYLDNLIKPNFKKNEATSNEYDDFLLKWSRLLNQPIPDIKRISVDIEVDSEEGRMPTARDHDKVITAVGLSASDGFRKVFVLKKDPNFDPSKLDATTAELCDSEKEMILKVFAVIQNYPIVLTFNGDDFDLPYLYARSQDPSIDPAHKKPISKELVPILVKKDSFVKRGIQADPVSLKHGIHIDLFRTFQNKSVQNYAFSHKYSEFTLNAICEALLNDTKIDFDDSIGDLPLEKLAEYCLKDADLTFRLTSFNDNLLIKLLIIISRISRMSIEDITRFGVNQWIRSMMFFEHRQQNIIIPRKDELQKKGTSSTVAIIKEKKYRGGLVVEPILGIHFNVIVVDFASLYPSIIKVHNLSYETVNCPHENCRNDPSTHIEQTNHWVCKQKQGMTSILIGTLRDLRVNYYKYLSKDNSLDKADKQLYGVISQAIKVILNATYGVMGAEIFPLYCLPVAEATAAVGRITTTKTIEKCNEEKIEVVYGDTDSLFLKNPSKEGLSGISSWSKKELGIDLEIDKRYRYVVFSDLKKNYLGVLEDGTVDVKGLTGKKSHTPPIIRQAFYEILNVLKEIFSEKDFEKAKEKIKKIVQSIAENLEKKRISLEELSFNVMINKAPGNYGIKTFERRSDKSISLDGKEKDFENIKGIPQHIKAANQLVEIGKQVKAGDIISYVKTRTLDGVKPVALANQADIDTEKYLEAMESTFDQILSSLNLNFKSIIGKPRQANLDELFWN